MIKDITKNHADIWFETAEKGKRKGEGLPGAVASIALKIMGNSQTQVYNGYKKPKMWNIQEEKHNVVSHNVTHLTIVLSTFRKASAFNLLQLHIRSCLRLLFLSGEMTKQMKVKKLKNLKTLDSKPGKYFIFWTCWVQPKCVIFIADDFWGVTLF